MWKGLENLLIQPDFIIVGIKKAVFVEGVFGRRVNFDPFLGF